MLQRRSVIQQPTARSVRFPASVGGWNAYDALDAMPKNCAVILDNLFPETTFVRNRRGHTLWCNPAAGGPVNSLMDYGGGASQKLLAGSSTKIVDVTTSTPAVLGTGFTSSEWQHTNFATLSGNWAIMCNGADAPQKFDGTTLSAAGFTGPSDVTKLCAVAAYAQRLWFAEKGTLNLWYGDVGGVTGAVVKFPIGALCARGGSVAAIGSWTREGTAGVAQIFAILTTNGEIILYQGTDPADAATFALVGRFTVGYPPAGHRQFVDLGPDLIVTTEDGFLPLTQYLSQGQSKAESIAISAKIGNAVTQALATARNVTGWNACLYPRGNMLIFNVPLSSGVCQQYVVNTLTGAWSRWTGQNARCWRTMGGVLFFGGADGKVYQADTGYADNGTLITCDLQTAYQRPANGAQCRFTMARPSLQVTGSINLSCEIQTDYANRPAVQPVASLTNAAVWGSSIWGVGIWGGSYAQQSDWISVSQIGFAASVRMRFATGGLGVRIHDSDVLYERGGYL